MASDRINSRVRSPGATKTRDCPPTCHNRVGFARKCISGSWLKVTHQRTFFSQNNPNPASFICFLHSHFRSSDYRGDSNFNALFTPLTFLVTYFNSGVNPLLYAFLSRNFRKGMRELLLCSLKKNKNKSSAYRIPMHVSIKLHNSCWVVVFPTVFFRSSWYNLIGYPVYSIKK